MIDYVLTKEPKGVTIIEGFPGFGLVGNIAIEFLLEHLKAEEIGEFIYDELPATVAIHKGKIVKRKLSEINTGKSSKKKEKTKSGKK